MCVDIASALSRQGRRVVLGRRCIPQVGGGLAFESLIRGDPVLSVSLAENAAAPDDPKQSNNGNPATTMRFMTDPFAALFVS